MTKKILQSSVKNRILAALPADEFVLLADDLRHVDLALGETLHHAGQPIDYLYFVESGFISALTVLSSGQPLEIGLIGSEGAAGALVVLGATVAYSETMCQTGGSALRIPVTALKRALAAAPSLKNLMFRYVLVFHVQVAQTAACNAHHEIGQRLCRWLLAAHDRSGVPELSLTQDLIAVMLGVRRSTVSVAARRCKGPASSATSTARSPSSTGSASRTRRVNATGRSRGNIGACSADSCEQPGRGEAS